MMTKLSIEHRYQKLVEKLLFKSAEEVTLIDLTHLNAEADVFLIATANSDVHMRTLLNVVEETLDAEGTSYVVEGRNSSLWGLIDTGKLVVHIFSKRGRDFYRIESIWGDAPTTVFAD
ncbi:ribosome silencing factor [Aminirod propionatiphilus]